MTVSPPDHWESHTHGYPEPTLNENHKKKRKIQRRDWVKKNDNLQNKIMWDPTRNGDKLNDPEQQR